MMLTGKTIGQLTYLSDVTNDTLFPVEFNGGTYHIDYSSITNYEEILYSELYSKYTGETLTPGKYYLITDFQTCYDQPDFDYNGTPITGPNTYHISDINPILVLATSNNTLSPNAYQPSYPKDKITYDITFTQTEVTTNPAKGRITERIDEYNNRTDYDHRTILFKRYRSYFQDGSINGRIIEMNNGLVTGLGTSFDTQLTTGDTIWILSQNPQLYEVISVDSAINMTVAGFNYDNFSSSIGYECQFMFSTNLEPVNGVLYYFNDVPDGEGISDGGNDMYDGGNYLYTDLFSQIPYTHTKMTEPPFNSFQQAGFGDFVYDGTVQNADSYFNTGSNYFTNLYPGLFVMSAYDVNITDFEIDGNLGSDGGGLADLFDYTLNFSGTDYSVYCKRVWGAQDPSVNHVIIVNTIDENISHTADLTTEEDRDTLSNLTGVTQIHYLLFGLAGGVKVTNTQIENVVNSYLSLIDETDINTTLSNLNLDFLSVTSNLPENQSGYKSLNPKQTNITGDTENYNEYLTFGNLGGNFILNNYIGDYSNTYQSNEQPFILSNNVFYGTSTYQNNKFGNSCYNNTFDDDCTENTIGDYFYNNVTDDDFDGNLIGHYFYNNTITANFQNNRIGNNFNNNTIINNSFYRNGIGNDFNSNVITNNEFQNNEIGNQFNNNFINFTFYKNDIGNGFNNNKTYFEFYGNLIGNGFDNNNVYSNYYENIIGEVFRNNTIGDTTFSNLYNFNSNTIKDYFQNNTLGGTFSYNSIGTNFEGNQVGDGFGFGFSTSQGNVIGNYFYNNSIGEYFYNNIIADGFYSNTVVDYFQLNNVKFSLSSTDFTSATYVYGNYNCELFINSTLTQRLSYYDGSDVLNITNITD